MEIVPRGASPGDGSDGAIEFIDNCGEHSIAECIVMAVRAIKRKRRPVVRIATPFLSNDYSEALGSFMNALNPESVHLHLRSGTHIGPRLSSLATPVYFHHPTRKRLGRFHAKIVVLDYGDLLVAYLGSANFTNQGFFLSAQQGGNIEAGILLVAKGKTEILATGLPRWFREGWTPAKYAADWDGDPKGSRVQEQPHDYTYTWAERLPCGPAGSGRKSIRVIVYIPNEVKGRKYITVDGGRHVFLKRDHGYYEATIRSTKNQITVKIGEKSWVVAVFDHTEFQVSKEIDGDSLFSYAASPFYKLREKELKRALVRDGIKVFLGRGQEPIIEPPLLERYRDNVRAHVEAVESRRVPTESYFQDLKDLLGHESHREALAGGTGIYLLCHLIRVFRAKGWADFEQECRGCAMQICESEGFLDYRRLSLFLRGWCEDCNA